MSTVPQETVEAKPGDLLTTNELLEALDRRNCRYVIVIQTEEKSEETSARVEMTTGMLVFEAFGLAELIQRHCERWMEKCVECVQSPDEDEGT